MGVLAEHRVLVHHRRDVRIAVHPHRRGACSPAQEGTVASERGEDAQQGSIQAQRVHGPPVLRGGQAERERDVHQAERGLDIEVEQPAGTRLRIDAGNGEHAEIEVFLASPTERTGVAKGEEHPVDIQVVLDHGVIAETGQRGRPQADFRDAGQPRVADAEAEQVRLDDEMPDEQGDGGRSDESAQEPQAHTVHGDVGGEPDRADPPAGHDGGHR